MLPCIWQVETGLPGPNPKTNQRPGTNPTSNPPVNFRLGGRTGPFPYSKFVEELTAVLSPPFRLNLADFLTSGLLDMVLFGFLKESSGREGKYKPGLALRIGEDNVEEARRSPITTRHAVAHGLVSHSSQQCSLNAIFIADCVFSVMFGAMGGTGCSNCPQIPRPTDRTNRIC